MGKDKNVNMFTIRFESVLCHLGFPNAVVMDALIYASQYFDIESDGIWINT